MGKKTGGTSSDRAYSIACDNNGNIILGGEFKSSPLVIGTATLTHQGTSPNYSSLFVKYDSNGNPLWAYGYENSKVNYVATDNANNTYFTGFFVDSLVFSSTHLIGPGGRNMFIVEKDAFGNDIWAKSIYTPLTAPTYNNILYPLSISQNISNAIYLTGYLYGQDCYFDSLHFVNPNSSGSANEMFLTKINSSSVGIEIFRDDKTIAVFPNPTSDYFHIDMNPTEKLHVNLYDFNGRLVFSENANSKSDFNVTKIEEGVYTLKIHSSGFTINKKLIIIH